MLTAIEKVLLLQDIDVFEFTSSEALSLIALITEEISCDAGEAIYEEDGFADAMYVVVEGRVRLHRNGTDILIAGPKQVFGTWALFDDAPRVATATPLEFTRLLRIEREDFYDLLADHVGITEGIFKSLVKRIRALVPRS